MMAAVSAIIVMMMAGCQQQQPTVMKAKQIPLEDFFKNPDKTGYQSVRAALISHSRPLPGPYEYLHPESRCGFSQQADFGTDRDIMAYFWPNDYQILYLKDQEATRIQALRRECRRFKSCLFHRF